MGVCTDLRTKIQKNEKIMKKSRFLPIFGLTKAFALPRIIVCREAGLSFAAFKAEERRP
jgi:hypothetical protein